MVTLGLKFFGATPDIYYTEVVKNTVITREEKPGAIPDGIEEWKKIAKAYGSAYTQTGSKITFNGSSVTVDLSLIKKAAEVWDSVARKAAIANKVSFVATMVTLGLGVSFSILEGKSLKTGASIVGAIFGACLTRLTDRIVLKARSEQEKIGNEKAQSKKADAVRFFLVKNGLKLLDLDKYRESAHGNVKYAWHSRSAELFAPKEKEFLFQDWLQEGVMNSQMLKRIRKFLANETHYAGVIDQFSQALDKAPEAVQTEFGKKHQYFAGLFNGFQDPSNGFLPILQQHFADATKAPLISSRGQTPSFRAGSARARS